jgi:large subunit ribosomal protein L4
MAEQTLYKQDASEAGKVELKDSVFKQEVNQALLHESVVAFLANQRQGTRGTRTRAFVSGGGKKPWKQKHTGRARQGSIRAPQWKGGGTVHGPQPRDFSIGLNKKVRQGALRSALSLKTGEGALTVLDAFSLTAPKTKEVTNFLKGFKAGEVKVVLVSDKLENNVKLGARNVPNLLTTNATGLHPYHLLWADKVFVTKSAVAKLEEALG